MNEIFIVAYRKRKDLSSFEMTEKWTVDYLDAVSSEAAGNLSFDYEIYDLRVRAKAKT